MKKHGTIIGFIALCLIWSSTWLFIKLGLETMPPFLSAGIRFIIAALVLFLYSKKLHLPFPRDVKSHLFFLFFSFAIFTVSYGCVYWSEQYINSGLTSVLFAVMPFYTAVLSVKILPSEHVTVKKMIGIIIGISGVVIIFYDQLKMEHPLAIYGMIAVLISPIFSAYGTLIGKKVSHDYHPVILNTLPLLYAGITFLIISFLLETYTHLEFTSMAVFSVFYLAIVGTATAFVIYFWMLKTTSAILMSSITFFTPPLALIWGWLALGEPVSWQLLIGMIIIFTGIYFVRERKVHLVKPTHI
jgi:drug/metabolite transporter (DMT)-like permease